MYTQSKASLKKINLSIVPLEHSGGFPVGYKKADPRSGYKGLGFIFGEVFCGCFLRVFLWGLSLLNLGNIGLFDMILVFLWGLWGLWGFLEICINHWK